MFAPSAASPQRRWSIGVLHTNSPFDASLLKLYEKARRRRLFCVLFAGDYLGLFSGSRGVPSSLKWFFNAFPLEEWEGAGRCTVIHKSLCLHC